MIGRKRRRQASSIASRVSRPCPLGFEREVDHHDRVLLDDADQQQNPNRGDDGELDVEQPERQRRSDAGGEQGREDGDRMDQALVENPEHNIDRDDRGAEQKRHARLRLLIGRGGAGEGAAHGRGHADALDRVVDLGLGLAERAALGKVERDRRRRERSLMIDAERGVAGRKLGEGRKRNHRFERGRDRRASRSGRVAARCERVGGEVARRIGRDRGGSALRVPVEET